MRKRDIFTKGSSAGSCVAYCVANIPRLTSVFYNYLSEVHFLRKVVYFRREVFVSKTATIFILKLLTSRMDSKA